MPVTEAEIANDLQPLLDQELNRLPEKYRAPLVLCELHGKSRKEAARQLRCPEGTLSSRLARARQILRRRLARRGLVLSAAALGGALSPAGASAAVPVPLLENTIKAAMSIAAGQAAVPAQVAALTEGVIQAMFLTKIKIVTAVCLVIGLLAGGAGFLTRQALAEKPAATVTDEEALAEQEKQKKEKGPGVQGTLLSVDAGKSITVNVPIEGTKQTEAKKFDLAADVKLFLNNDTGKKEALPEGKLTDLVEGTSVGLELSADKKAVVAITARGPKLQGRVKSVDAAKNTITLTTKEKENKNQVEKTLELVKDIRVLLNDGLKKGDADKQGKLSDLTEGTSVVLQLSVDRKTALEIRVHAGSIQGRVKGVDGGTNTITIVVKEDGNLVEKSFTVDKEARIEGKLTDLVADTAVSLQFSVFDPKKVVAVNVIKKDKEENQKDKDE